MKIAVTGSTGFIGSAVAHRARAAKYEVVKVGRAQGFRLGEPVDEELFSGVDVLVHCAYDFSISKREDIRRINVRGTRLLLDAAKKAGVRRVIVLSSMSAYRGCRSEYGRAKLEIEKLSLDRGAVVVRPGLTYGGMHGGITEQLARFGKRFLVVPTVGNGKQLLHPCHVDDLSTALIYIAEKGRLPSGVIVAAQEKSVTFREILSILAGRKLFFIGLPYKPLFLLLRLLEGLGLSMGLRSDSLTGLAFADPSPDFTATMILGFSFRPFIVSQR